MSESEYTLSDHSSVEQRSSKRDDPFAILSLPYGTRPDPDEYLRSAMAWHFGTDTGSPFWLARAATLGFDPISEIRSYTDLARFPNLTDELRDVDRLIAAIGGAMPISPTELWSVRSAARHVDLIKKIDYACPRA